MQIYQRSRKKGNLFGWCSESVRVLLKKAINNFSTQMETRVLIKSQIQTSIPFLNNLISNYSKNSKLKDLFIERHNPITNSP